MKNANALTKAGLRVELCISSRNRHNFISAAHFRDLVFTFYNIKEQFQIRRSRTISVGRFRPERIAFAILMPFAALFRRVKIFYTRDHASILFAFLLRRYVIFETFRCLGEDYPRVMRFLSRFSSSRFFLGVITHSQLAADSIIGAGFSKDKVIAMHNGFDPDDVQPILEKKEARTRTNLPQDAFIFMYTGHITKKKGCDSIIELAAQRPNLTFILIGGGRPDDDVEQYKKIAQAKNIQNIKFIDSQPIGIVSQYLYAADVLLIPPTADPLKKFGRTVLPFKTFLYMAAGRPILAPSLPDLSEVFDENSAMLVPPDDYAAILAAIDRLAESPALCDSLAEGAKRAAARLTWNARGEKIARWIFERYTQAAK
jgi:glycosyltransferase involved in cell wall biosynthesis